MLRSYTFVMGGLTAGLLVGGMLFGVILQPGAGDAVPPGADASTIGSIGVRGDWTIVVRDPEGGVTERREFQNSLSNVGVRTLVQLLSREQSFGIWAVHLLGAPDPCLEDTDDDGELEPGSDDERSCRIIEPLEPTSSEPYYFDNLTLQTLDSDENGNDDHILLQGTATVAQDSTISSVQTWVDTCHATIAPADCAPFTGNALFTGTGLDTPIDVITNQQVAVEVVISFTTAN